MARHCLKSLTDGKDPSAWCLRAKRRIKIFQSTAPSRVVRSDVCVV